tara:strand:+ start:18 stop:887 length:870 start_codon:yes stop_codon:yes gene_type:complete
MKILILGASGEIGHAACKILSKNHDISGLMRNNNKLNSVKFFEKVLAEPHCHFIKDFNDFDFVKSKIKKINPDILINCLGVVKHRKECKEGIVETAYINSTFPHLLAETCIDSNIKFIHLSTDCVFSGEKGNYKESDTPDPTDYYGKSKMLGEVDVLHALTLRTSFIGPALFHKTGLFEWVKQQKNKIINGYTNAIYSGLTTVAFSNILNEIIQNHHNLDGLFNVSSEPISKFDLIHLLNKKFQLNININPDSTFVCDRSLDSTAFRKKTNISIPSWEKMIDELYYYNM